MTSVIELEQLSVTFGKRPILRSLDGVLNGRAIGLLGPNGAGKTTLIHTLLGFHPPTSGTARIFGQDITQHAKQVRAAVGYMPERDSFIAKMSCVHFVWLMAELSGIPAEHALERAHEALFYVGLGEARYRPVDSYSLGMKQLAKLAQAIVHGPELVLLDEPASGLDPAGREQMLEIIRRLGSFGINVIFSSHLLGDIEQTCDAVVMIDGGHLIRSGPVASAGLTSVVVVDVLGDANALADRLAAAGIEASVLTDQRLSFTVAGDEAYDQVRDAADHLGIGIFRMAPISHTLEDEFMVIARKGEP